MQSTVLVLDETLLPRNHGARLPIRTPEASLGASPTHARLTGSISCISPQVPLHADRDECVLSVYELARPPDLLLRDPRGAPRNARTERTKTKIWPRGASRLLLLSYPV